MKNTCKWLNVSQFTGALNDNDFKISAIIATCSALFAAPLRFLPNLEGSLEDRFNKRDLSAIQKTLRVS